LILVDSNVIIDVLTRDPSWQAWSEAALRHDPLSNKAMLAALGDDA